MKIKPGMDFKHHQHETWDCRVLDVVGGAVYIKMRGGGRTKYPSNEFLNYFTYQPKPLDIALDKINPHQPKRCDHVWRKDYFFSARIYHTCVKCGAKQEES